MATHLPSKDRIQSQIQFHDFLNPALWTKDKLRPEVRLKLFQAAFVFYRFLEVPALVVRDIILTGSNAAFNYTPFSDIDVHLVADFAHTTCPSLAENFFVTKKSLWSKTYDITIRRLAVELYVEDTASPVFSNGVYSILHGEWIKKPIREAPSLDDSAIERKVEAVVADINVILDGTPSPSDLDQMLRRIYTLRHNGLLHGGEFSTENLTFKTLRSLGYLDKLRAKKVEDRDRELSLL